MTLFHVVGLSDELAEEVRQTRRSPGFGHPVAQEVATGTGPCRACFETFRVGEDERLLFTYRPAGSGGIPGAPGPVFIHARSCTRYRDNVFPQALRSLPLLIEARADAGRVLATQRATPDVDALVADMLQDPAVEYLHVRHGEAGCHIARIERGPLPASLRPA